MDEQRWLTETQPEAMLELYRNREPWRKLLLFSCASLNSILELIPEGRTRDAVEVTQQFADSLTFTAEFEELETWLSNAIHEYFDGAEDPHTRADYFATRAVYGFFRWCAHESVARDAAHYIQKARGRVAWNATIGDGGEEALLRARDAREAAERAEGGRLCDLVREVFGNPFRLIAVDPAWLTATVLSLAEVAYAERALPSGHLDPARLAVLADALQEAGCDSADLLVHLRSPGPHVRGCWALDLVLGKV